MDQTTDIVFLGYEPPGEENFALRLLAATAEWAGFAAVVVGASTLADASGAVDRALNYRPQVLCLSLHEPSAAVHGLALAGLARRRGYGGYVLSGGAFSALQADWILANASAVDGVLKHGGEQPLVDLLRTLSVSGDTSQVPGIATREAAFAPAAAQPQRNWRPLRGPRPEVMGVPTAAILSCRGGQDHCDYCIHAAVRRLNRHGPLAAGALRQQRRTIDDLADEIAELHHASGVRYFNFVDENPVPAAEDEALVWIDSLGQALTARRVDQLAFGMMTRGDSLTTRTIDALVDLGLVRTLVGVEAGSDSALAAIGRHGSSRGVAEVVSRLTDRGVVTKFNCLILHPGSTPETIRSELDFLETVDHAICEPIQLKPFVGTRLHARMTAAGRTTGGELMPAIAFDDPVVSRFRSLLVRMIGEVHGTYSPAFRSLDLLFSATLACRFGIGRAAEPLEREAWALARSINSSQIGQLRQLLEAAQDRRDPELVIRDAARTTRAQIAQIENLVDRLKRLEPRPESLSRYYRNVAIASSFVFAFSGALACHHVEPPQPSDLELGDDWADDGTEPDGGIGLDTVEHEDTEVACEWEDYAELESLVLSNCGWGEDHYPDVLVTVDADGWVEQVQIAPYHVEDYPEEPPEWVIEMIECYTELLEGEQFPCLTDQQVWVGPQIPGE